MQLSKHFKLSEFTKSQTAARMGIDNTPPEEVIPKLTFLCSQILEPLREKIVSDPCSDLPSDLVTLLLATFILLKFENSKIL